MLSPSVYSLPDPYTAPCECFTVGSDDAGRFLIAYSWAPSLLSSLHLRTRTWFLLTQTWSLEIKKSHMGLGQVSTVDVPTWWSCASSKTSWQTGRCMPTRCLGEESMSCSSTFQVLFFSPVEEGLSKPRISKKYDHRSFKFGFALLCFLLSWWTGALLVHGLALIFWVVLKKKPWFIASYYVP